MSEKLSRLPEAQQNIPREKLVQFKDGAMASIYSQKGDVLSKDYREHYTLLRWLGKTTYAIIKTEDMDIGFGDKIMLNNKGQYMRASPYGISDITIGEPLYIPGAGRTEPVLGLIIEWPYIEKPGYPGAEQRFAPNPFEILRSEIRKINTNLRNQ